MIKLKKSELESTLLIISSFDRETGKISSGLLMENISLGTKRKLQKIHKKTYESYEELMKDVENIKEDVGEDSVKLNKEILDLLKEEISFEAETISLSDLDNIITTNNYNFDIIEKFTF